MASNRVDSKTAYRLKDTPSNNLKTLRTSSLLGSGDLTHVPVRIDQEGAPTVNDDDTAGFLSGDTIFDVLTNTLYTLGDNSTGAAVWSSGGGGGGGGTDLGNILYVSASPSASGSETRANALGNLSKPLTPERAAAVAVAGDLIHVCAGTYTITTTATNGLWVDGVNWYFEPKARFNKSTAGDLFRKPLATATVEANIYGYGEFYLSGSPGIIIYNNLAAINTHFEFNICENSVGSVYVSETVCNDTVIGRNYAKTTAAICINITNGKSYIDCPVILSTASVAIKKFAGTATTIISNSIENQSAGLTLDGSAGMGTDVLINAAFISIANVIGSNSVIMNVGFMYRLTAGCQNGLFNVSGRVDTLYPKSGEINVGMVAAISDSSILACTVNTT